MTEQIRTNAILNDRYLVQKELGQGGMGAVYLAQDMQNRRTVAIKVARLPGPEARAQFQREAGYLQKLHHHSLPRVWDYFSDTQRDFLVMEYIPGEDLETLVHRKGPQPEWLVLRWAEELLDGLEYLHSQNPPIIHRDIKPGNLKLRQDETLVLVDFGIAKEYLPGTDTLPGASAVTPGFSPLEQYSDIVTDARTDIYSVGATMYFLLTGHIPPPAPDRASGDKKLLPPSQLVPDTTAGTEMVTRKALSLPRDERWANASEMRSALVQASQQRAARETPPNTSSFQIRGTPPPGKTPASASEGTGKRPAGCIALVALAAVAILAAGALLLSNGKLSGIIAQSATPTSASATARVAVVQRTTEAPVATPAIVQPTVVVAPTDTPTPTGPMPTISVPVTPTVVTAGDIPTSTPIPTRTPTPLAKTPTPSPSPQPKTPTSVNTPTRVSTISPTGAYPSVVLRSPAEGVSFNGPTPGILLQWNSAGALGPNEYYVVTILFPHGTETWQDVQWTEQTALAAPDYLYGAATLPGVLRWNVVVMRETGTRPDGQKQGVELSPRSATWSFNWAPSDSSGDTGDGGSNPGPSTPTTEPPTRTPEPPPP